MSLISCIDAYHKAKINISYAHIIMMLPVRTSVQMAPPISKLNTQTNTSILNSTQKASLYTERLSKHVYN